ncbi:hypothetical protein ONV78_21930 [Hahella sp. CR1]|uniref:hypothetical protein n=1 Tax=Hahella sp. CR1 TaxID=2992807 RepID=UPI0024419FDC|nr:hypothetical protein [Hahella sp. CR1]MDG9670413.1 hypothetical protein [Hahella sp. CR1]
MKDLTDIFQNYLSELEKEGVVLKSRIKGWSQEQVEEIEKLFGVNIPLFYKLFVGALGEKSDLLIDGNEYEYNSNSVKEMNFYIKEYFDEIREEGGTIDEDLFPGKPFFILGRYATVFYFIVCEDEIDSKVYQFDSEIFLVNEACGSLMEFYEWLEEQAINGIKSGVRRRY